MGKPVSEFLEQLAEARDYQLERWDLANSNYQALSKVERRSVKFGNFEVFLQFNPTRAVSTGAKIDKSSIASRPCFLCEKNRPEEQVSEEIVPGWDFLVNPYPIFPLHFTIAYRRHVSQGKIPVDMIAMAEQLKGMTVFFNGARAGASAPDHLHCQTVMTSELPLMCYLESGGDPDLLPYKVLYEVITPDERGTESLRKILNTKGIDKHSGHPDAGLLNAYMWIGSDNLLRACIVPRSAHRPSFFTSDIDTEGYMVSPGAIDMAGVIVLPREDDFKRMTVSDLRQMFLEVAL